MCVCVCMCMYKSVHLHTYTCAHKHGRRSIRRQGVHLFCLLASIAFTAFLGNMVFVLVT